MGVLTARPRRPANPARRRARGPLLWSLALHGAVFVTLARSAARRDAPAELLFTVSVASAAAEDAPEPIVESILEPVVEPRPEEPALPEFPPLEVATPEPAPPEPDAAEPDEPAPAPDPAPDRIETVGPRSATTLVRRPTPPATARAVVPTPSPAPSPAPSPPPPPRPVQPTPPSVAAAGATAVEGARPDAGNQPPVYPMEARANRWTGVVTLRLGVDADGAVRNVEVAGTSGHPSLDDAAVSAAWGWRFSPARRGGIAVASSVVRRVRFVLDQA